MVSPFSSCCCCYERYNSTRIPHSFACGHTYCKDCINILSSPSQIPRTCPTCKVEIKGTIFNVNYSIQQLSFELCDDHLLINEFKKKDDDQLICSECVLKSDYGEEDVCRRELTEYKALYCQVCENRYNISSRNPKLIPCGHSICQECEQKILTCPVENDPLGPDLLPFNFSFLNSFEENVREGKFGSCLTPILLLQSLSETTLWFRFD